MLRVGLLCFFILENTVTKFAPYLVTVAHAFGKCIVQKRQYTQTDGQLHL